MTNAIVTREWNGKTLTFREDGYFNMTKAAKQFGKDTREFFKLKSTADYMEELSGLVGGIPLTKIQKGNGLSKQVGTWARPKLAVFFARWLDVRFAVACDAIIEDILKGNAEVTITKPEQSAAAQLPTDYLSALKALVQTEEEKQQLTADNQKLTADNKEMSDELNFLTINEYSALDHRYMHRGTKSLPGRTALGMHVEMQ